MGILSLLRDYVVVPTCPVCRERLALDGDAPFCEDCLPLWEREKRRRCAVCGLPMYDCGCLPPLLTGNGVRDGLFLTSYRASGSTAPGRLIYSLKAERDGRAFGFLSRELAPMVRDYSEMVGLRETDAVVSFLPRRRAAVREHGFDQAEVLAKYLARETGFPFARLLVRTVGGREQKELNALERRENLKKAFRVKTERVVDDKTIFLVDDVLTTGSGMLAAVELLFRAGAASVVPVVIARTVLDDAEDEAE